MYVWKIERPAPEVGYDENDAFVIAAPTEPEVRRIAGDAAADEGSGVWLDAEKSEVTAVAVALPLTTVGIVLRSFCAG